MSVIVMGMEMPKHGDVLVVREYNGKTYIKHEGHLGFEATLHKIPTPHGRLGDLDKLEKELQIASEDPYLKWEEARIYGKAISDVRVARTIIKAEGEA